LEKKDELELVNKKINGIKIIRYINSGGFGHVYEGVKNGKKLALKIPIKTETKNGEKCILEEFRVYQNLNEDSEDENPNLFNVKISKSSDLHESKKESKFMVMDLLGDSLETTFKKIGVFNIKQVCNIAIQMITIIRFIHSKGYIHRDLKPENFVFSRKDTSKIYCIDFGLAKKIVKRNGEHIDEKKHGNFCGTARYASIQAHKFNEQSRRDDLECIGYILIYLLTGNLPWNGIRHKEKIKKYKAIGKLKEEIAPEKLCEGLPKEFACYFRYIRSLDFNEKPLYTSLKNLFLRIQKGDGRVAEPDT
jgi:casein kinase 1